MESEKEWEASESFVRLLTCATLGPSPLTVTRYLLLLEDDDLLFALVDQATRLGCKRTLLKMTGLSLAAACLPIRPLLSFPQLRFLHDFENYFAGLSHVSYTRLCSDSRTFRKADSHAKFISVARMCGRDVDICDVLARAASRPKSDGFSLCDAVRDVCANPFAVPAFVPSGQEFKVNYEFIRPFYSSWLSPDVIRLVSSISYQWVSGTYKPLDLLALADAVDEAGDAEFLTSHLRRPGPHHAGCHAVSFLRGAVRCHLAS